jgi:hypothetical protein
MRRGGFFVSPADLSHDLSQGSPATWRNSRTRPPRISTRSLLTSAQSASPGSGSHDRGASVSGTNRHHRLRLILSEQDLIGDAEISPSLLLCGGDGGLNVLSVVLGNGDGTFQPAWTYAAGTNPQLVAVGDFNGDGLVDLAVANASRTMSRFSLMATRRAHGDSPSTRTRPLPSICRP